MKTAIRDGSRNPCTKHYEVSPGHPPFEDRARFLGEVAGSWFEIGQEVGSRAGDLVRWVSDVWWGQHMEHYGKEETMQAMDLYAAQVEALDQGLIRFMEGIAEGAAPELDKSPFAKESSHYQKVLNTNIFDAWSYRHPTTTPWKEAEPGEMADTRRPTGRAGSNTAGSPASISATEKPHRASILAAAAPTMPAPTTAMSN